MEHEQLTKVAYRWVWSCINTMYVHVHNVDYTGKNNYYYTCIVHVLMCTCTLICVWDDSIFVLTMTLV